MKVKCASPLWSVRGAGVLQSSSELQRWTADTVSGSESQLHGRQKAFIPPPVHRGPGFSLNDLHTALKNAQWSHWHLDSSRFGALYCKTQQLTEPNKASPMQASGRPQSGWPGRQNRKAGRAAAGGASWKFTGKSLEVVTGEEAHSEGFIQITWCTQSPGVPANLLHNGGQVSEWQRGLSNEASRRKVCCSFEFIIIIFKTAQG